MLKNLSSAKNGVPLSAFLQACRKAAGGGSSETPWTATAAVPDAAVDDNGCRGVMNHNPCSPDPPLSQQHIASQNTHDELGHWCFTLRAATDWRLRLHFGHWACVSSIIEMTSLA